MKRPIALLLVFSIMLSLSGCGIGFDKEAFGDYIKGEISDAVDDVVDQAKEEASNQINGAINDAKEEASQKMDEVIDGVKSEVGQVAGEFPTLDDNMLELPQKDETEKSGIDNLKENAKDGWDDFWGRDLTITYHPNGGRGGPQEQHFKANTYPSMPAADKNPIREGYHFVGWTTEKNSEPQFFAGQKVNCMFIQNTTLYACWEKYNPDEPFAVKACMGQTLNYGGVFELIGGSAGYQDIIIEHNYHLIKEDGKNIRIQCDCGFELVDRNLSLDNFVIIKSEREYMSFDALDTSKKEEYSNDYNLYCMREGEHVPKTGEAALETSNAAESEYDDPKESDTTNWLKKLWNHLFSKNTSSYKCNHEIVTKYNEMNCIATCECGTTTFVDLTYEEFVEILEVPRREDPGTYAVVQYSKYVATNITLDPAVMEFLLTADISITDENKKKELSEVCESLSSFADTISSAAEFDDAILDGVPNLSSDFFEETSNYFGAAATTLSIVKAGVDFVNFAEIMASDTDKTAQIEALVTLVKNVTEKIPMYNRVFDMALDTIVNSSKVVFEGEKLDLVRYTVWSLETNGRASLIWNYWNLQEHRTWKDGPSLLQLANAGLTKSEIAGLTPYIEFRLNYELEEIMGMTLGEIAEKHND